MKQINSLRLIKLSIVIIILAIFIFLIIKIYEYMNLQYQMMQYPLIYSDYVEKYSDEFDVDKYLIYAIIKTESGFKTDAVSNVGARGLMQIMEDTFDWIKYRLDDEEEVYDDMFTVNDNIRYGTYLIGYNLEYFGNMRNAIAAYHAGTSGVSIWLENNEYSDDGKTLKKIPSSDTGHYVNKVEKAYLKYKEIYDEQERE